MEEMLMKLLSGMPVAAAVLYIWIVSEKNHNVDISKWRETYINEIAKWRETVEQKDKYLLEMQNTINKMVTEIQKLTFIIENYVIRDGKNPANKQNQRSKERP